MNGLLSGAALLSLAVAGCAPALPAGTGLPAPEAARDGRYQATGRFVSGSDGCFGREGLLSVSMTIADGQARLPLRGGSVEGVMQGPVGTDGNLGQLRWTGTPGVAAETQGRVAGTEIEMELRYDYAPLGAVRCLYRYAGRRI